VRYARVMREPVDVDALEMQVLAEMNAGKLDFSGLPDDLLERKLVMAIERNAQSLINRWMSLAGSPGVHANEIARGMAEADIRAAEEGQRTLRDRLEVVRLRRREAADVDREKQEAEVLRSSKNATWWAAIFAGVAALPTVVPEIRAFVKWIAARIVGP
jgi:hypothetical protein